MANVNVRITEEVAAALDKIAARMSQGGALAITRADAVRWCIAQALRSERTDKGNRKVKA